MRILNHVKLLGIVFLCLLLAGVYLTYAVFSKKFVDYDKVTLQTSTIGLQLPRRADVKVRGVIVGEVLGFSATADGADVTLGPDPAGGFRLTGIKLTVRGTVDGLDEAGFVKAAEDAKAGCPISKALTGVDITLDAALA